MINGVRLKVCGITSLVDADLADGMGADYLGFIFYPKSPRWVSNPQYRAMKDRLPPRKKVAVSVEPAPEDLAKQVDLGFDFFQIHFNPQTPLAVVNGWVEKVGAARLWLAPRLPPGVEIYPELLPLAETFLIDTFHPDKMGGTGETGDWAKFKRFRETLPAKHWILSGGLDSHNVAEAVTSTGAKLVDVNSGVEQAPGIKSPAKLKAFVLALHNAAKHENPQGDS
ncbi:MAG: Phosphoribosylanthranilate isomerase [Lacunisphaera sp.]|nr:Phosphoribosylanthranilate isomerase [Lacunisphaera sp.]